MLEVGKKYRMRNEPGWVKAIGESELNPGWMVCEQEDCGDLELYRIADGRLCEAQETSYDIIGPYVEPLTPEQADEAVALLKVVRCCHLTPTDEIAAFLRKIGRLS